VPTLVNPLNANRQRQATVRRLQGAAISAASRALYNGEMTCQAKEGKWQRQAVRIPLSKNSKMVTLPWSALFLIALHWVAGIASHDALILPHRATPDGWNFGNDNVACRAMASRLHRRIGMQSNPAPGSPRAGLPSDRPGRTPVAYVEVTTVNPSLTEDAEKKRENPVYNAIELTATVWTARRDGTAEIARRGVYRRGDVGKNQLGNVIS
jgi:hypothetical protein